MKSNRITVLLILSCLCLFLLQACKSDKGKSVRNAFADFDTLYPPVMTKAGEPVVHYLDTCPDPEVTVVSSRPAPVVTQAGFFVNMPNFNTEHGLAMSGFAGAYKDKAGNLWFGTSGNGISKFDGKSFTNYTSNHGLIHNLVTSFTEDNEGNLWIGTYGGVSKFDGIGFENFTTEQGLISNDINVVLKDKAENIWISTPFGVSKFDLNKKPDTKTLFVNYSKEQGLAGHYVGDMLEDSRGQLWFATNHGISRYDAASEAIGGPAFVNYPFGDEKAEANTLVEDSDGQLWIGTNRGVAVFDPHKGNLIIDSIQFTTYNGLISNEIRSSCMDRDGNFWAGSLSGVSQIRKTDRRIVNFTTQQGLAHNQVNSIIMDDKGSLWFATRGGGLSRYDGESVTGFTKDQGLEGPACLAITEDQSGRLWMCGENGGLVTFNPNEPDPRKRNFTFYGSAQGFSRTAGFVIISDSAGNLWFSADEGLGRYNGKTIKKFTTAQGLIAPMVVSLMQDSKGRLWIGTYESGISLFDGKSFSNFTTKQGLVHNTVWSFCEDRKGNVWMATRGGLSLFDGKFFRNFTTAQGLTDNKLSWVTEDKNGNILIGSWGGGVSVIRKQMVEILMADEFPTNEEVIFENFTTNEGLANDVVYSIVEDKAGNIFIGTTLGFTVLKGGIGAPGGPLAKNGIEYFNQKTGYPIKDIYNNYSMYLDKKGIFWAGTGDQLVRFDYEKVHRNSNPPKVFIESVQVNNEKISWHTLQQAKSDSSGHNSRYAVPPFVTDELNVYGRKLGDTERDTLVKRFSKLQFNNVRPFYAIPENLVLPFAFNNISFDFAAVETARPAMMQYQYMLEGYDKTWSPPGNKTTASFGNISEGIYTFMVKARSPEGVWSDPVIYRFEILPPFYRTWPAYLFYALLLVAGIFAVDRFQRSRLIARERQRNLKLEVAQAREIEKAYTELKSTQAQLIQSEKMASLGELAAGIAHEIQNPLNFVNNFSEVSKELISEVQDELAVGNYQSAKEIMKDVEENLDKINHHGKRADAIIKGMLQHSRSSAGAKEPTDINALAGEYFRLAFHGLRARDKSFNALMETGLDESIGKISIIPQEIGRVILNLITNAFYAVNERRKLSGPGYQPTVWLRTRQLNSRVEVEVADNGNGIPDKDREKIFQPFFTTKPSGEGTGLGLSMSYDIVTKGHGGELKMESQEGEGTTFTIVLPIEAG